MKIKTLKKFIISIHLISYSFFVLNMSPLFAQDAAVVDKTQDPLAMGYPDSRKIVRDSKNNLFVAYRKKFKSGAHTSERIFVARSSDEGRTWTQNNNPIDNVGDFTQRVPSIAIDSQDRLHVVWYGNDQDNQGKNEHQIKYAASENQGQSWSSFKNIAPISGYKNENYWQEHPTIFIGSDDAVNICWQGKTPDSSKSQIKFIRSTDHGYSWTNPVTVSPEKMDFSRPSIIALSETSLMILCYAKNNKVNNIYWTTSRDQGQTWNAWAQLSSSNNEQRFPSVAGGQLNSVHAVWKETDQFGSEHIMHSMYDGQNWNAPYNLKEANTSSLFFPSISVSKSNAIYVVWTESPIASVDKHDNPTPGTIYGAFKSNPIATWSIGKVDLGEETQATFASFIGSGLNQKEERDLVWTHNTGREIKILYKPFSTALIQK